MASADVLTTDEAIDAALERAQHSPDLPGATAASYHEPLDAIVIDLEGGRRLLLPRRELQGLESATASQLAQIEIHAGVGIAWPQIDVDHYLPYLLAGQYGSNAWMRKLEARGRAETPNNSGFAIARLKAFYDMYPLMGPLSHLDGKLLLDVAQKIEHGSLTELIFRFESQQIVIRARPADDTIEAVRETGYVEGESIATREPWTRFVGQAMGWSWLAMNQQGYFDTVLLGLHDVAPSLAITTVASELELRTCEPLPGTRK